mmetsp:Transcript_11943/g.39361  ORF Transcript_11943/g.39361 Transcript_11943/m.39361 type:complete len:304 (+) Transcript_11943:876-1787(+)
MGRKATPSAFATAGPNKNPRASGAATATSPVCWYLATSASMQRPNAAASARSGVTSPKTKSAVGKPRMGRTSGLILASRAAKSAQRDAAGREAASSGGGGCGGGGRRRGRDCHQRCLPEGVSPVPRLARRAAAGRDQLCRGAGCARGRGERGRAAWRRAAWRGGFFSRLAVRHHRRALRDLRGGGRVRETEPARLVQVRDGARASRSRARAGHHACGGGGGGGAASQGPGEARHRGAPRAAAAAPQRAGPGRRGVSRAAGGAAQRAEAGPPQQQPRQRGRQRAGGGGAAPRDQAARQAAQARL